jgi:two-component system CheB/CheR fusion protein
MNKAQLKSKSENWSGTRPKTHIVSAAPDPGSVPRNSGAAGRKRKRGDKAPSRRDSKGRRVTSSGSATVRFPIVGIGASAGGLEACTHLLQHVPFDIGMGFVLVQHLDPAHPSALTLLLARATQMPVHEASNNVLVQPNHLYVIPPNAIMAIARGHLKLQPRLETSGAHRSIDFFFESLARDQRERAIGVILSGTASDGTLGLEAIKAEGGITFAQDESAKYDSMPRSAIISGCVDFVLSPEEVAKELAHIARHPYVALAAPGPPKAVEEVGAPMRAGVHSRPRSEAEPEAGGGKNGFKKILHLLYSHSAVDFSPYKLNTIQRRINRRMVLSKLTTLDAYARILRGNAKELDALYSDLLINVTGFFRNPESFEVLKRTVLPALLEERRAEPIRIWVPGCSSGQEVYSLAMAISEYASRASRAPALQIFATDLNQTLLDKARAGLYTKSLVQDVSPERLRRFFIEEDGGYRICKPLREIVVFARQNLLSDPPFSRIDLISCRNLLIYLEPGLQKHIMLTFHYALKLKGFLFLGASESIGPSTELFEPVDKKHKIYFKKPHSTPVLSLQFAPKHPASKKAIPTPKPSAEQEGWPIETSAQREADRVALVRYSPASVLVNADWQVLQFRGDTSPYLKPPTGRASFNILKMARQGLMLPLRTALNTAKHENRMVRREVRFDQGGQPHTAYFEIVPLKNLKEQYYLIFFQESPHPSRLAARRTEREIPRGGGDRGSLKSLKPAKGAAQLEESTGTRGDLAAAHRRIAELEHELTETRDYLQSIQEQYEAGNEEIQASNEEVTSANEELQSINEELETSKEELESTNEELTTVNEEMATRNVVLHQLNSDLVNLQRASHVGIVLLKRDLTIHRFTTEAEKPFNLLATDVGRPLSSLRHNFDMPDLERFISAVIDGVRESEREVTDKAGRWFSLRVRPYLNLENKVDGAVLVLVDIDALKRNEMAINEARAYAETVIRTVPDPLIVLKANLRVHSANEAFYSTFKVSPAETEGRSIFELGNGKWDLPELRKLLEEVIPRSNSFDEFEFAQDFERIGHRTFLVNARMLKGPEGGVKMVLLGMQDVSQRKRVEAALAQAQHELEQHARGLEQIVGERTVALRETVRELEAFSYSISHDLRAPLRAMNNFSQILREHHAQQLDETGRDYLQRISTSAARLDRLIQDVLNYTRILRAQVPLTRIDMDKLLRELIQCYPDWQPPQVDIQIEGGLPPVQGHEGFLTQCVSNLLNNAVKFVTPGIQPRVRIWAEPRDSHVRINFQDNGVGITPDNGTRIFRMFERIHPTDEYEGTGIGLTIVRKAMERMGGKVDFESEPGRGSKFWLELRKSDPS